MAKEIYLNQYKRRMTELSFPPRLMRRKAEELSDHYDFLIRTTLKEGKSDVEANTYAAQELGNPVELAEQAVVERRQACWWSRHTILGFIIIPIITLALAFALTIFAVGIYFFLRRDHFNALGRTSRGFKDIRNEIMFCYCTAHYLTTTLTAVPFIRTARRCATGLTWPTVTCVICAVQAMFLYPIITQNNPNLNYHWMPHLLGGLGPLLVIVLMYWRHSVLVNRLPELPAQLSRGPTGFAALGELLSTPLGERRASAQWKRKGATPFNLGASLKKALSTPTYWVVVILPVVIFFLVVLNNAHQEKKRAENQKALANKNIAWAGERSNVEDEVRARQSASDTTHETTIDLKPYINVRLDESTDGGPKGFKENSLSELPSGTHTYGGVPFDVQGRIQLMGKGLQRWRLNFPAAAKNITIGRKCSRIFLFHGENCNMVAQVRGPVARLVLHYTNGAEESIDIISGEHLLDWWGVTYTTEAIKERRFVTSPDSELAWVGKSPLIGRNQPQMSLRLYKSTFANPQPGVEISSIDYVSTVTQAAPFLVGLTVE